MSEIINQGDLVRVESSAVLAVVVSKSEAGRAMCLYMDGSRHEHRMGGLELAHEEPEPPADGGDGAA